MALRAGRCDAPMRPPLKPCSANCRRATARMFLRVRSGFGLCEAGRDAGVRLAFCGKVLTALLGVAGSP